MASSITFDLIDMTSPAPLCLQAHPIDIVDSLDEEGVRTITQTQSREGPAASNYDYMDCDMDVGCKDQPIDFCMVPNSGRIPAEAPSPVLWKQAAVPRQSVSDLSPRLTGQLWDLNAEYKQDTISEIILSLSLAQVLVLI